MASFLLHKKEFQMKLKIIMNQSIDIQQKNATYNYKQNKNKLRNETF